MPALSFLAEMGRKINRAKIGRIFELAQMTREETDYMLLRHCDRQTREFVHDTLHLSLDRQRALEGIVTDKILSWLLDNLRELNILELLWLRARLSKRGVEILEDLS